MSYVLVESGLQVSLEDASGDVLLEGGVLAPTVVSTVPTNSSHNAATSTTIAVTFSEAMIAGTITTGSFTVTQGSTSVAGTVAYNAGTMTATFTPTSPLTAGKGYTATLSTAIQGLNNVPLASPYVLNFAIAKTGHAVKWFPGLNRKVSHG